jgi:hypothetical protein
LVDEAAALTEVEETGRIKKELHGAEHEKKMFCQEFFIRNFQWNCSERINYCEMFLRLSGGAREQK